MPLKLEFVQESDLDAYVDILCESFQAGTMSIMYPNGITEAVKTHHRAGTLRDMHDLPHAKHLKVVDSEVQEKGGMVGISDWKIYATERTEAELEAEGKRGGEHGFAPGTNIPMVEEYSGVSRQCKRENMGTKPFALLNTIATRPDHQRRGIGAMHLEWGLAEADRLGLPAYLEASKKGKSLYARWGFEPLYYLPFDPKDWGAETDLRNECMIRPAKGTNVTANGISDGSS